MYYARMGVRKDVMFYFQDQIVDYICYGGSCGGFMWALMSGDLYGVVKKADDTNRLQIIQLAEWIHSHAPVGCYGSQIKVQAWVDSRGLQGKAGSMAMEKWKVINNIKV